MFLHYMLMTCIHFSEIFDINIFSQLDKGSRVTIHPYASYPDPSYATAFISAGTSARIGIGVTYVRYIPIFFSHSSEGYTDKDKKRLHDNTNHSTKIDVELSGI